MRERYSAACSHESSATALANVCKKPPQPAAIVGHGDEGIIATGSGERVRSEPLTHIGIDNYKIWVEQLKTLEPSGVSSLTLCACDTGAGEDGADLLFALAQALNAPVRAPTGLVIMGIGGPEPLLEPCADWQEATPDVHPQPKPRPIYMPIPDMSEIVLRDGVRFTSIPVGDVAQVQFVGATLALLAPWVGDDARRAVTFGQFDHPMSLGGVPGAIVSGTFVLTYIEHGHLKTREFLIYNNRLLQDTVSEDMYYHANISALLQAF